MSTLTQRLIASLPLFAWGIYLMFWPGVSFIVSTLGFAGSLGGFLLLDWWLARRAPPPRS